MLNHLTATVQGLTTIRAFHAQNNLTREFDNHQDVHTSAWFLFISCSRAFGMYVDLICSVHISVTILLFLFLDQVAPPGDVGLVISQSMMLIGMVSFTKLLLLLLLIFLLLLLLVVGCVNLKFRKNENYTKR